MKYVMYIFDPASREYKKFEYLSYKVCNEYYEEVIKYGYSGFMLCSIPEFEDEVHWSLLSNNLPRC